ncbi:MAG: hypothetical protein AABZ55_15465 [Bdellovibrionota bacterium]
MIHRFIPATPAQWSWITLAGPDAQDFVHRLTTIDAKHLDVGQGAPGFFLTAQGKVRAYFRLWRYQDQGFAFEFDAGEFGHWKKELLAAIDQFTFTENMKLVEVSELSCIWLFTDSTEDWKNTGLPAVQKGKTIATEDEIRICFQGTADFGKEWITVWGRHAQLETWLKKYLSHAQSVDWLTLETWRVLHLRPSVGHEIDASTIPLEVGLKDAIAENKGCYPGQEVIERIVALGAPARRLARLDGVGEAPQIGESVLNRAVPPLEVGIVTSVVSCDGRFSALALIRKVHAKEGMPVGFSVHTQSEGNVVHIAPYA